MNTVDMTNLPPSTYRPMLISWGIETCAKSTPHKAAIIEGDIQTTYGELASNLYRVANAAIGMGLGRGDRAAIVAANDRRYFEIVCGIARAGAATATLNPRQTVPELRQVFEDCEPRIIFASRDTEDAVRQASDGLNAPIFVLGESYEKWRDAGADQMPDVYVNEWDTFAIPYTSGTTGTPKGVELSHRSRSVLGVIFASLYGCFHADDRFLVTTPLFHGGGFAFPIAVLNAGGTADLLPKYAPDLLVEKLGEGLATGTFVVPTQLRSMAALPSYLIDKARRNKLRSIICNAAPLSEAVKYEGLELFGDGLLHETYASTEAGIVTNLFPSEMRTTVNSVGRAVAGVSVEILDEDGTPVAPGEVGEIYASGPTLFNGYLNKSEETARGYRRSHFSAGDLARMDEDGFIYVIGRKKDMIITGGVNVYPGEVEKVLQTHPAIVETAIIGLPHAHWGEIVCACVVTEGAMSEDDVLAYSKSHLAPHKQPKIVRFVDQVPKNVTGKVLKKDLRERFAAEGPDG